MTSGTRIGGASPAPPGEAASDGQSIAGRILAAKRQKE
jgi:hypothetical protein